jgi:hypothetical protein
MTVGHFGKILTGIGEEDGDGQLFKVIILP